MLATCSQFNSATNQRSDVILGFLSRLRPRGAGGSASKIKTQDKISVTCSQSDLEFNKTPENRTLPFPK